MIYEKEREQVAAFMRRLYRQFLNTTSGGNISCRLPDGNIAVTASQSDKANQQASTVGVVTPDGETLTPELKLSIETGLHLAIYQVRPDIGAIVHAHPVMATFFTASKVTPLSKIMARSRRTDGNFERGSKCTSGALP